GVKSTAFDLGDPIAAPAAAGQNVEVRPGNQAPVQTSAAPLSVVLVEPSRTQAGIVRRDLHECGIEQIVIKSTGQAAAEAVRAGRVDVIVSAMHLDDMTGVDLARQILGAHREGAPGFLLISTASQRETTDSLSGVGNARILTKPFTMEQLAEAL